MLDITRLAVVNVTSLIGMLIKRNSSNKLQKDGAKLEYKLFLDTCALLNLQADAFSEHFIISQKTLEEIEHIKTSSGKDSEVKYKARRIAELLDQRSGEYTVVKTSAAVLNILVSYGLPESPDNIILSSVEWYAREYNQPLILVSDDINVKFIAREIFSFEVRGSKQLNIVTDVEEYMGYKEVIFSDEEMSYFYMNLDDNKYGVIQNEYLIVRQSDGEIVDTYRWDGEMFKKVCSKTVKSTMFGDKIKPKDVYQACAIDSIMNNSITALTGKAGSGKTLISLVTIMNLIETGEYDRVVIMFNPTKARGAAELGYYSGSALEKAMQSSIGSILTTKFGDKFAVDMLIQQDRIRLVSMADVRGMEVRANEILYITECQNTTIDLLKLCLTRVSSESKVIIEGDYNTQVDSYLFGGSSNGMKRAIDVFSGEPEFGYVHLPNIWRSRIAELADKL